MQPNNGRYAFARKYRYLERIPPSDLMAVIQFSRIIARPKIRFLEMRESFATLRVSGEPRGMGTPKNMGHRMLYRVWCSTCTIDNSLNRYRTASGSVALRFFRSDRHHREASIPRRWRTCTASSLRHARLRLRDSRRRSAIGDRRSALLAAIIRRD